MLVPILIALISGFIGIKVGISLEKKRLIKNFDSEYYADLWRVVQNVNGVIRRGRRIRDDTVMNRIRDKYSCGDINAFLNNFVFTNDRTLTNKLADFSDNLVSYNNSIAENNLTQKGVAQNKSESLKEEIYKRIINNLIN
jgi:hypothetical protein